VVSLASYPVLRCLPKPTLRPRGRLIINVVNDKDKRSGSGREYPPVWEKIIPVILWILGGIVALLVLIIFAVALGWLPGMV
jgi:hypothetical protein